MRRLTLALVLLPTLAAAQTPCTGPALPVVTNPTPQYPSPYERGTLGEISQGDKYAVTANEVKKPKRQAQ